MFERILNQEKDRLDKEISKLRADLLNAPQGNLILARNGKHTKWYRYFDRNTEYIRKSEKELAVALAKKKYQLQKIEDAENEKYAIENCIKSYRDHPSLADYLIQEDNPYAALILDSFRDMSNSNRRWEEETYIKNPYHPEGLTHRGVTGEMYRSKSEVLIEIALLKAGVPFRYECQMLIGNKEYYPDFTCKHPYTGELYIWEHYGMMDVLGYARKAYEKIADYGRAGFYPGINLIITSETSEHPIDARQLELVIERYFSL